MKLFSPEFEPYVYRPLTHDELKSQRSDFDLAFYEKMLRKEYDSRLRMDFFAW